MSTFDYLKVGDTAYIQLRSTGALVKLAEGTVTKISPTGQITVRRPKAYGAGTFDQRFQPSGKEHGAGSAWSYDRLITYPDYASLKPRADRQQAEKEIKGLLADLSNRRLDDKIKLLAQLDAVRDLIVKKL